MGLNSGAKLQPRSLISSLEMGVKATRLCGSALEVHCVLTLTPRPQRPHVTLAESDLC